MDESAAVGTVSITIEPLADGNHRLTVTTQGENRIAREEITVRGDEETFQWIRNLVGTQRAMLRRFDGT